ncbi:RnfH family protein [Sphaerotilus natans]|uniref:RnfH family protein n=1 Tax=Sphaerotilus natans TaxID=34103 RepID=UPI00406C87D7
MAGAEDTPIATPVTTPMSLPMQVEVAFSPGPRQIDRVRVTLAAGASAAQALAASGLVARHAELAGAEGLAFGIGGRLVAPDTPMQPGDRLDICRPLKVDPKEARRQRYRAQGEGGRRRVSGSRSR